MARHGYQTTLELLAASKLPERLKTPPHVQVCTPKTLSSPFTLDDANLPRNDDAITPVLISEELLSQLAKTTPWHRFTQHIAPLETGNSPQLLILPSSTGDVKFRDFFNPHHPGGSPIFRVDHSLTLRQWVEDLWVAPLLESTRYISDACIHPTQYLPQTGSESGITLKDLHDPSQKRSQLELLKLIIHLFSNGFGDKEALEAVVLLAQEKHNRQLLKSLLRHDLLSVTAFAEKLLVPAAAGKNLPLLDILLESGVDIDVPAPSALSGGIAIIYGRSSPTALQVVIEQSDDKMVTELLHRGANSNIGPIITCFICDPRDELLEYDSLLDLAVELGNIRIVRELLKRRAGHGPNCSAITIETLRIATLNGHISIINLLIDHIPGFRRMVLGPPSWLLIEAAAYHGKVKTMEALVNQGVQFEDFKGGCALSAACYHANMPLMHHLLKSGVDVNEVGSAGINSNSRTYSMLVPDLEGIAPLHIAVLHGNEELVKFLLSRGADVNKFCGLYAIQIAARKGYANLVQSLLQAGADVHAVWKDTAHLCWYEIPRFWINLSHEQSVWDLRTIADRSALQLSLEKGSKKTYETLQAYGAQIPTKNSDPQGNAWNPLQSAMLGGSKDLVFDVLNHVDSEQFATEDCFATCIKECGCDFTRKLIDMGVFTSDNLHHRSALCHAVEAGDADFVEMLLLNAEKLFGKIPHEYGALGFAAAVRRENDRMIEKFLCVGFSPWDRITQECGLIDSRMYFPAGSNAFKESLLLPDSKQAQKFTNLCLKIEGDGTPLSHNLGVIAVCGTAIFCGRFDIARTLIEAGLNIGEIDRTIGSQIDGLHCSALQITLQHRCNESRESVLAFTHFLLDIGVEPNFNVPPPGPGFITVSTALQCAVMRNEPQLTRILLERGANINDDPQISHGATATQYACMNGNFEVLNILLKHGADINAPPGCYEGRSAIEGAAELGRLDMTRYLLELGADMKGRGNRNYRRTIYRTWKNGHRTLVHMIQDWKSKNYGTDDCERPEVVVESMTADELDFADSSTLR